MRKLDNYELRINNIIDKNNYIIENDPNIIGMGWGLKTIKGVTTKTPVLTILVKKKYSKYELGRDKFIPPYLFGALTDIEEIGEIPDLAKPQAGNGEEEDVGDGGDGGESGDPNPKPDPEPKPNPPAPTKPEPRKDIEHRPAYGGISPIGALNNKYYGSVGYLVTEKTNPKNYYALTCLHVLDSTLTGENKENIRVLQPPEQAKGTLINSLFGTFEKGIKMTPKAVKSKEKITNEVDAAIVKLGFKTDKRVESGLLMPAMGERFQMPVVGIEDVKPGDIGWKLGAHTGITDCTIKNVNVSISLKFSGKDYPLIKQIRADMAQCYQGDAGTLGLRTKTIGKNQFAATAWGLLVYPIAKGKGAIFNPIGRVMEMLDIQFVIKDK